VRLDVRIVSPHDIPFAIIDRGAVTARSAHYGKSDQRQDRPDGADNHENDPDIVNVESVLVWPNGNSEVENGSNCDSDNTGYKSSGHSDHLTPLVWKSMGNLG
jgi:hypothetical protein